MNNKILVIFLLLGWMLPIISLSDDQKLDPRTVVLVATDRVINIVQEATHYYQKDPERYYAAIKTELDGFVDFRGFARGVMGKYATSGRYRNLDDFGKKELRKQLDEFTMILRETLVRTYSKGLLAFGGVRIELDPDPEFTDTTSSVSVKQFIFGDNTDPYVVVYQMRKVRNGSWKLRNMIVEEVNLGLIFRNQFEAAVEQYDGDLNKVISAWASE